MGVPLTGTIQQYANGAYPTHNAGTGADGWRSVNAFTDLNAIPSYYRVQGMAVWVQSANALYTLNAAPWANTNADWTQFTGAVGAFTDLISGGGVAWVSGYTFEVSAATYYILGTLYTSAQGQVTLAAADPTFDRYDVIALDNTGAVVVVQGTAAATPIVPQVDPASQLALTTIYVQAGSTSPPLIVVTLVYDENAGTGGGEWNSSSSGAGWALASTNSPYHLTHDIEATSVAASAYVQLQAGSPADLSSQTSVVFYIKSKAQWPKQKSLVVQFYSSGSPVGRSAALVDGAFGFSSANTSAYQQIVMPISLFGLTGGSTENQLRFTVTGSGAAIGFYLDYIQLQAGGNTVNVPVPVAQGGTGDTSFTPYALIAGGTANTANLQSVNGVGTNGQVLTSGGPGALPTWANSTGGGNGTVTSVGLALPSIFTVANSPVTTAGTINATLANTNANLVFAGPTSGNAAAPAFRAVNAADLPKTNLNIVQHYGTPSTAANTNGTITLDFSQTDQWQTNGLTSNSTLAFSNTTNGQHVRIKVMQGGGNFSLSWPSGITWYGSPYSAPSMPVTNGAFLAAVVYVTGTNTYDGWWLGSSNS